MKILFNTPRLIPQGGVANHYIGLKPYWSATVLYNPIGKNSSKSGSGLFRLPLNVCAFIYRLFTFKPDIIVLNPSLSKSAMVRDMIFLRIAHFFGRKTVVFIHGFNESSIPSLNIKSIARLLNKTQCVFVLAKRFRNILQSWDVTVPVHLTTTKVDNRLLQGVKHKDKRGVINNILFLARITKEKGIFITLQAFQLIKHQHPHLQLHIVGNGPALESAKSYCKTKGIYGVTFYGALSGDDLKRAYSEADLYLFPTAHAEGMPTSVLEAMAFGLPVITRPVGGLVDFFENDKMGQMVDSLSPVDFAEAVAPYLNDAKKTESVSSYNKEYAKKHFLASSVAKKFEEILKQYI